MARAGRDRTAAPLSTPSLPNVAGIDLPRAPLAPPAAAAAQAGAEGPRAVGAPGGAGEDADRGALTSWIADLTTLHELTSSLSHTAGLDDALHEVLRAGALLVGARRGFVVLRPADGLGPIAHVGLGLSRSELGAIETIPRHSAPCELLIDAPGRPAAEILHPDLAQEPDLDPRHREVAARLGCGASYAVPLVTRSGAVLGAAVWLFDEPTVPPDGRRQLLALYLCHAAESLARRVELRRTQQALLLLREGLLPPRLPQVPGARLAVRHCTGPRGGGDWYDVLPLSDGALGLALGSVTGSGAAAVAAMGRLRAGLRAYAVMEGEDPVAVLSDLELLMRQTEGRRTATALYAHVEPGSRRLVLAGAGHCPPLITGDRRTEFAETTLSAPLGMLACWEAPSIDIDPAPGETVLLYTDGLLHRSGEPMERALSRLHQAASCAPPPARQDPQLLADHVLRVMLPDGPDGRAQDQDHPEDVVLLAVQLTR
ncbi:PP2C family protein-serine/threonine phosphatase [Streptomyces polyrhachis]|uniref:PP2C family protein-serine/threonine phosphatase n=1 Tax=Streptomyces polyrhachis TaxID=1282885 RepID=A0ABW2GEL9_9ACTN